MKIIIRYTLTVFCSIPLLLAIALTNLLFLAGCSGEEPVQIGFIGGLSGRGADLGISGRNGVISAVEQRNKKGGINGQPIHLIAVDDKQDENTVAQALTSLFDQGVEAVIGHMTSSMSVSTLPIANERRIVMMSPTTTTTDLSNLDDYFFRVCASTDTYGAALARYFYNAKHLSRITIIYDLGNKAYTESWTHHFREEFTRLGGEIIQIVTYTSGPETRFSEVVRQALLLQTDGLIICASAADAAMICHQVHKMKISIPIGTSAWAATEQLIELGGISVEDVTVSQFFDRFSTDPRYIQFRDDFNKRFGHDPGFASVGAYDATNIVLDALARKEKNQDLKQVILRIGSFNGIQGNITFNRFGDSDRATFISIIQNGKFIRADNDARHL